MIAVSRRHALTWTEVASLDEFTTAVRAMDDALERAVTFIRGLKLGVDASVPMEDGFRLVWGHMPNEERRVLYVVFSDGIPVELKTRTLSIRMQACSEVPTLIDALRATRDGRGHEIQATADRLFEYLLEDMDPDAPEPKRDPLAACTGCYYLVTDLSGTTSHCDDLHGTVAGEPFFITDPTQPPPAVCPLRKKTT